MEKPGIRLTLYGDRKGLVKSLWFKTFTHNSFSEIWDLFYITGKKTIQKGLIKNNLTEISLAYWIMGDGSLQSDNETIILHTQSYTYDENILLSTELNEKFGFETKVISHKQKYWVIKFSSKDGPTLRQMIKPYMHISFSYKIPIV